MKNASIWGILVSLATLGCAPVATSVPKMATLTPHSADSLVGGQTGADLRPLGTVKVVSAEQYDTFEKNLDANYKLVKYDEKDAKVPELRKSRGMANLDLASPRKRIEVLVILVLKRGMKSTAVDAAANLKIRMDRDSRDDYSFLVSNDDGSEEAWNAVKENVASVVIAYREAAVKN